MQFPLNTKGFWVRSRFNRKTSLQRRLLDCPRQKKKHHLVLDHAPRHLSRCTKRSLTPPSALAASKVLRQILLRVLLTYPSPKFSFLTLLHLRRRSAAISAQVPYVLVSLVVVLSAFLLCWWGETLRCGYQSVIGMQILTFVYGQGNISDGQTRTLLMACPR